MAKTKRDGIGTAGGGLTDKKVQQRKSKRTSIGKSKNSRPNHKNAVRHKGKQYKRKKTKH